MNLWVHGLKSLKGEVMKYGVYEAEPRYYIPNDKVAIPNPALFCGQCGNSLTDTDFFCSKCGLKHQSIEFLERRKVTNCADCQAPYSEIEDENFCHYCGHPS